MIQSKNAEANTVSAVGQIDVNKFVSIFKRGGTKRVLFFGNSITRHEPNPDLGWYGDWGMAASSIENDFVHVIVRELDKVYGKIDYCIAQGSKWERGYTHTDEVLNEIYSKARDFKADIVIVRIGENITPEEHLKVDCKSAVDEAIRFLASNENAKVIVTDMFWYAIYNHVFREIAEERGYVFCHITDLEEDESTMAKGLFEHKGVAAHPGDWGMKCIADRILAKIFE